MDQAKKLHQIIYTETRRVPKGGRIFMGELISGGAGHPPWPAWTEGMIAPYDVIVYERSETVSKPGRDGVYVASRASIPVRSAMWRGFRKSGAVVNSSWIDEAGPGETADLSELWDRIESEIDRSVGLILYVELEDFPLKGALIEVGIAIGKGIPVYVVAPDVNIEQTSCRPLGSWILHPLVTLCPVIERAYEMATGRGHTGMQPATTP